MKPLSTLLILSLLSLCVACNSSITQSTTNTSPQIEQEISSAVIEIMSQQDMAKKQQAYQVLLKYAEQSNPDAIYHLGQFYIAPSRLDGVITPDSKKAEELLLKSANMNHKASQIFLGSTYKFGGHGFPRDKEKACYWMKKSVESESNPVIERLMKDCL
ncbi:tetratricopeptide repeat protein [Moraxella sp. ZY210820]|uniref:tetratricopeptide repeat protein n=1 Tax=unclassified Moraxella TaxID=2685852 RepID=UPI002731CFC2|nr:tetratricopeptide repeat protein [Moraxella sp. ZY210820]WLF84304.1 sel1 repeat family protein [Moraxella sp. ZY210820]